MKPVASATHAVALILAGLLAGCGTVEFEAPPGRHVRLLDIDTPTTVHVHRKVWYAGWGLEPLGDNSTASMIEEHRLKEVRMATEQTFMDTVASMVTSIFSFSVRTVYVEGNP